MHSVSREEHYKMMTETPVRRLVVRLAIPTIISMLVSSIYNMADTFFVSQLGTSAAGAVGIVFSVMAIIQAIGFTIGMGAGNIASRKLGAKDYEEANRYASSGFFLGLVLSLLLLIFGTIFIDDLMRLLGATETILPYARDYARYILLGSPVMCLSFIMNNYFRAEGKAVYGMVGITIGGVLNIILDPIFIFALSLGTAGAAIATALSQFISFIILLAMFLSGKSNLKLSVKYVSFRPVYYRNMIFTGLPTLARQGLASIATIALNVMAASYGDAAVAAMSIANRITFFLFSFMLGLGQGFQPVAAFNYGAKLYTRVHDATKFTSAISTFLMVVIAIICFVFARPLIMLFRRDDLEVISIGVVTLRAQCVALTLTGITTVTNMALQSTGQAGRATLLAMCRQGFFFIPIVLTLPHFIGLTGVEIAQSLADILTFLVSLYFFITYLKELKAKRNAQVAEDLNRR